MTPATLDAQALETGRIIHSRANSALKAAAILQAPPAVETSATAGMIIALGLAMTPGTRHQHRGNVKKGMIRRLLRTIDRHPVARPRPVQGMAAELLTAVETRGTGFLTQTLMRQAELCRENGYDTGAALERITPLREQNSVFHTSEAGAVLMAHLVVPEQADWGDPATLTGLTMADYACGHGALLEAVYRRARKLHQDAGGDPAPLHRRMMETCITGTDISAAATGMAVERLAGVETHEGFVKTRVAKLPDTPDEGGEPRLGALDLLLDEASKARVIAIEGADMDLPPEACAPGSQQIVVMNPPFNTDFRNLEGDSQAIRHKLERIAQVCGTATPTSAAMPMALLALRNTAPGGRIGLILPLTAAAGATSHPDRTSSRTQGWTAFRNRMLDQCAGITVITPCNYRNESNAFSHDTEISEAMIIARKLRDGEEPPRTLTYVNIDRVPANADEAQSLGQRISAVLGTLKPGDAAPLPPGDGPDGNVHQRLTPQGANWNGSRKLHPDTVLAADAFSQGRTNCGPPIPMTSLSELARVTHSQEGQPMDGSHGNGEANAWILKGHDGTADTRLAGREPAPACASPGMTRSRTHISTKIRFNSQPTAACLLDRPAIAGKGWASVSLRQEEWEKPLILWLNTTMGLLTCWAIGTHTCNGWAYLTTEGLKSLQVPDLRLMRRSQLDRLHEIYDAHAHLDLMRAADAWRDPVRQRLDRATLEALTDGQGTDGPSLTSVRARWCLEPTVAGHRGTTEVHRDEMETLRAEAQAAERAAAAPTVRLHQDCLKAAIDGRHHAVCPHCAQSMAQSG